MIANPAQFTPPPRKYVLIPNAWRALAALLLCLLVFAPAAIPAQAQVQDLRFEITTKTSNLLIFNVHDIPATASSIELYSVPPSNGGNFQEEGGSKQTYTPGSVNWVGNSIQQMTGFGYSAGTRVFIEAIAYDSDGNRVGYGALTVRTTYSATFTYSSGAVSDFWFNIDVQAAPEPTKYINVKVSNGGTVVSDTAYQVSGMPKTITVGNFHDSDFDPATSVIKPGTTYNVEIQAVDDGEVLASGSLTVTTSAERTCYRLKNDADLQNCKAVNIHSIKTGAREIEFIISGVSGADYYKVPDDPSNFNCSPGRESSATSLGTLETWRPKKDRYVKSVGPPTVYANSYTVRYCGLRPDRNFSITLEAYRYVMVTGNFNGRTVTSRQGKLIARKVHTIKTKPTTSATATPAPPFRNFSITFENFTDITVSWSLPPNQSAVGNKLEIFNDNSVHVDNRFLLVPLFRGQTSQRVNGLTEGKNYNVRLTLGFIGGVTRSGEAGIRMSKRGEEGRGTGCLGCQDAPPDPPTATPVDILIGIGVDSSTEATLSWNAISGATGYLLEYSGGLSGGNVESGSYTLGAGATSQRVTGLTPGGSYDVTLTVNLQGGSTHRGTGFFIMPAPPPTNTPIPPPTATNTPVPQPAQDSQQQPSGPYASLITTLLTYEAETQHGPEHVKRWTRALAALGWGSHANPMTLAEAKQMAQQFSSARWDPVVAALTQLQPPPPPTSTPVPPTNTPIPPTPIPPTPVPPTPIPPPPPTAIPPTAVPPTPVPPTPVPQQPSYTVPQSLIDTLKGYEAETQHGPAHVLRWTRALAALGHGSGDPMSLSEAKDMARQFSANRWNPVIEALEKLAGN